MKKCGFWKKALVYLSVMAMTPQSIVALGAELTAEAMEPDSDVLVRWIPDEEEVRTGEEGSITLEAELNHERGAVGAAQVTITLTRQEAEAMLQFQQYAGEEGEHGQEGEEDIDASSDEEEVEEEIFPGYLDDEDEEDRGEEPEEEYFFEDEGEPFLVSDKGDVPIRIVEEEGNDEVLLVFVLDEENSYLRQEFQFCLPLNASEMFDIDVTEDDISVVTAVPLPEEEPKKEKKEKKDKPDKPGAGTKGPEGVKEPETTAPAETDPAVPEESGSAAPEVPGDSVPGEPGDAAPEESEDAAPEEPEGSAPEEPGADTPEEPGDAAPEESGDTSDAEDGEEAPEGGESSEDAGVSAPGEDSESGEEGENSGGSQEDTGSEAGSSEEAAGGSDASGSGDTSDGGSSESGDTSDSGSSDSGDSSGSGSSESGDSSDSGDTSDSGDSSDSGSSDSGDSSGSGAAEASVSRSVRDWPRLAASNSYSFKKTAAILRMTGQDPLHAELDDTEESEPEESEEPEEESVQKGQEGSEEESVQEGQESSEEESVQESQENSEGENGPGGEENSEEENGQEDPEEEGGNSDTPEAGSGQPGTGSSEETGGKEPENSQEGDLDESLGGGEELNQPSDDTEQGSEKDPAGTTPDGIQTATSSVPEEEEEIEEIEEIEVVPAPTIPAASVSTATASTATASQIRYDGDAVIQIETRPMSFTAEFGWEMEMEQIEPLARSAGEPEEILFRMQAVSQNREETGVLYTAEQSFRFDLQLPPELAFPEGTVTYDSGAGALQAGGTEIAVLEGMPADGQITEIEKTDDQNLSFTLLRRQEELEEEMADLDLTIRVVRESLMLTEEFAGQAEPVSAEDAAAQEMLQAEPVAEISRSRFSGMPLLGSAHRTDKEMGEGLEELFSSEPRTKEVEISLSVTAASIPGTGENYKAAQNTQVRASIRITSLPSGEAAVVERMQDDLAQTIIWVDNENEMGERPKSIPAYTLTFTLEQVKKTTGGSWQKVEDGEVLDHPLDASQYYEQLGMTDAPAASLLVGDDPGRSIFEIKEGDSALPSIISYTADPLFPDEAKYYRINWILKPAASQTGENWANYEREIKEDGWYYHYLTTFTFDAVLRWGDLGRAEGITNAVLKALALTHNDGIKDFEEPLNGLKLDIDKYAGPDPENPTSATVTISGIRKYEENGKEIDYWVQEAGEQNFKIDDLPEAAMEEGDYFAISYDNANAPNYGNVNNQLHSGGCLYLTLSGTTDYSAEKVWKDSGNAEKRPTGTFQLWRFREGEDFSTAAPVRDAEGNLITFALDTNPEGNRYEISSEIMDDQGAPLPLDNLEKYDSEGYAYIYVLREYLDAETEGEDSADSYKQVFGEIDASGEIVGDILEGYTGDKPTRAENDINLYNGGTLTNRITGSVRVGSRRRYGRPLHFSPS